MNSKRMILGKSGNFLVVMIFLQFLMSVTVVLNIMIARQVIGFLYLTFIPGFILLRILKMDKLDMVETISFSVGLSIAFLMIVGLLTNEFGLLIGVSKPLSTMPLIVVLNGVMLSLCIFSYLRDKDFGLPVIGSVKLEPLAILVFCLPLLSVAGALLVNASPGNNSLLLLMFIVISGLVVLALSKKMVSPKLYPLLLMAIAVALLLHSSLISNHINGFDVQHEYKIMKTIIASSNWIPNIYDVFQSLLSVTILPTIYWNLLNVDGVWVSKIIYPLIFAFVPLVLYKLYRGWVSEKMAFLAAFFFMANNTFFTEMLSLGRQMIAELFFVLLFFTLFNKKMSNLNKMICFTLFSFALVASHYGISYIFMLIIFSSWLILFYLSKNYNVRSTHLKISFVILYSVILFSWYIYVSSSATFDELLRVWEHIYRSFFTEFFSAESRGETVLMGVGMGGPQSFIHLVGRIFAYATELLIVIGFVTLIIKRKEIFDNEYVVVSSLNMALLAMCIILPRFAGFLGMTRFYHIVLFLLAPLCILGGKTIFSFILKSKNETLALGLVLIILVPYFLFQTGLVYEVTGVESWSVPLSKYRFGWPQYAGQGLIEDQDIFGVKWLSEYNTNESVRIYADGLTRNSLLSGGYGMFPTDRTRELLSNATKIETNGIVYLRWANTFYGIMYTGAHSWNTTEYVNSTLNNMNKIYTNGDCETYKNS